MSVPDRYLDEDDEALCSEHGEARPCRYCRYEYHMQMAELMRDDTRESNP